MPQTVESKVANFRRARELKAQGKPSWIHNVDIRSVITESAETDIDTIMRVAHEVARRLRAGLPPAFFDIADPAFDFDFNEAIEDLESYNLEYLDTLPGNEALNNLNGRLDEIYDWADRERVWLGG